MFVMYIFCSPYEWKVMCLANACPNLMGCYCGMCTMSVGGCLREVGTHVEIDMQLMDGTLYSFMKNNDMEPIKYMCLMQIAMGLHALHSYGIIHRDLKPNNILHHEVDGNLVFKICDYGLAVPVLVNDCSNTHTSDMMHLFYRAPEVFGSKHYGQVVDVWSFGCVAYEVFKGGEVLFDVKVPVKFTQNVVENAQCILACMHLVARDEIVVPFTSVILKSPGVLRTVRRKSKEVLGWSVTRKCLVTDPLHRSTIGPILNMLIEKTNKVL